MEDIKEAVKFALIEMIEEESIIVELDEEGEPQLLVSEDDSLEDCESY